MRMSTQHGTAHSPTLQQPVGHLPPEPESTLITSFRAAEDLSRLTHGLGSLSLLLGSLQPSSTGSGLVPHRHSSSPKGCTCTINLEGPSPQQVCRRDFRERQRRGGRGLPVATPAGSAVQLKGDLSRNAIIHPGKEGPLSRDTHPIPVRTRQINSF